MPLPTCPGPRAARLHDPGARVEPGANLPSVSDEHLAQAFERELSPRGITAIQRPIGAGEPPVLTVFPRLLLREHGYQCTEDVLSFALSQVRK